ncbi:uncharacterized protein LOC143470470 [Clavelina lepadiformis]|uniref:uncharacterized protein LOC143470470 n=1 Tax=Clavelina lepadiformis TaxID=159417 RepID=UPI004041C9A0
MGFSVNDIIQIVCDLATVENFKVTLTKDESKSSVVGGFATGAIGAALGQTLGPTLGTVSSSKVVPLSTIILELPKEKKEDLADRVTKIWSKHEFADAVVMLALVHENAPMRKDLIKVVKLFLGDNGYSVGK